MKLLGIDAANVMRLRAFTLRIDKERGLVIIGGANGAGKSSALDSFCMAIGGAKLVPDQPLREGRDEGFVTTLIGDESEQLKVTRRFWRARDGGIGQQLEITNGEGMKQAKPQALLDTLLGALAFDPMAFARMAPKEQAEMLRQALGIDFTDLDKERQEAYDSRTLVNRDHSALRARLAAMPEVAAPDEPVSLAKLAEEYELAMAVVGQNTRQRQRTEALEREVEGLRAKLVTTGAALKWQQEATAKLPPDPDTAALKQRMADVEQINRRVGEKRHRAELVANTRKVRDEADCLSERIDAIDKEKRGAAAAVNLDIPGLALDVETSELMVNHIPFAQASTAEKIRVSAAIGLAMNPRLRVMLIRDGEKLDPTNMQLLADFADEHDAQFLVEDCRATPAQATVIIEDGCGSNVEEEEA